MISARNDRADQYDANYFQHGCGIPYERNEHWQKFFAEIAEAIVQRIAPHSVLDAGCAMGFLVEALRQRGVEAWGLDISEYAISKVHPNMQPFCALGLVTDPLSRRYDLIVCIEVLEHLIPREAERAVVNFCQHSDDLLFSSTPLDYKEVTHCNVQPPEHWTELFAREHFFRDVDFDTSFIAPWAVRFRHMNEPLHRIVRGYERRFWPLQRENADLRDMSRELRDQVISYEKKTQDLDAQIVEKDQRIQSLQARIEERDQTIQSLQAQIVAILNSRSWRIMKPLQQLRLWVFPLRRPRAPTIAVIRRFMETGQKNSLEGVLVVEIKYFVMMRFLLSGTNDFAKAGIREECAGQSLASAVRFAWLHYQDMTAPMGN
jgi:SAM-dependent methyltransferase